MSDTLLKYTLGHHLTERSFSVVRLVCSQCNTHYTIAEKKEACEDMVG